MITKRYSLTRMYSFITSFNTPSGRVVVNFENGSRHHGRNGYYITSNKELQEAIEKSAYFGTDIILEEQTIKEEKPLEKANEEPVKVVIEVDYKDFVSNKDNLVEEQSVTTIQKAKMWLQANYGKTFKGTSKAEIKKEAAELYNTIFVNWV